PAPRLSTLSLPDALPISIDAALDDDLNTPQALAELAAIASAARKAGDDGERARLKSWLLGAGLALGLLQQEPAAWFARGAGSDEDRKSTRLNSSHVKISY